MNSGDSHMFVYLLIDNGLLNEISAGYTDTDPNSRPEWLRPIYPERALEVSPLLVDAEAAYQAGDLDQIMHYLNALSPALHVSIIETRLEIDQMAQHLRRFIFILDMEGKQLTLRYADCAVLAPLSSTLTTVQWATMSRPIERWSIHDRSGALIQLPTANTTTNVPTPLHLDRNQLTALDEASEPDHYVAKVQMMRHNLPLPGSSAEHHAWVQSAIQLWRVSGNTNPLILTYLVEASLVTRGHILNQRSIHDLLATNEVNEFRDRLRELVREFQAHQISETHFTKFR